MKRIVPNVAATDPAPSREFYAGFLGLNVALDLGWIATYVSTENPSAQVSVIRGGNEPHPALSVEVDDVDQAYRDAVTRGYQIVYPLTDEPWGVRRFFVADPNGVVVNVLSHAPRPD